MNVKSSNSFAHRTFAALAIVCALAAMLTLPAAATASPEDVWESVSVTALNLDLGKEPTLVIAAALRDGIDLPAEAALAIPKGATIVWAGELTGDFSSDPILDIIEIEEFDEYDLVRFKVTTAPFVQFELGLPEDAMTSTPGGRQIGISWTAGGSADRARIAIATPFDIHVQSAEPSATVDARADQVLYSVEKIPVEAGDRLELSGLLVVGVDPGLAEEFAAENPPSGAIETGTVAAAGTTPPIASRSGGVDMSNVLLAVLFGALLLVGFLLFRTMKAESQTSEE